MEMTLAQILYELPTERLREIAGSRASTIHGFPRVQNKAELVRSLAAALTNYYSVERAIHETTKAQLMVLATIASRDGHLDLDDLAARTRDSSDGRLKRVLYELETLGLAFSVSNEGRAGVYMPRSVAQLVPVPAALRLNVDSALENLPEPGIIALAQRLCIENLGSSKDELISALADAIRNPDGIRDRTDRLPTEGKQVLEFLIAEGGAVSLQTLAAFVDNRRRRQVMDLAWAPFRMDSHPRNGVEAVLAEGLAFQQSARGWASGAVVMPADVMEALSGGGKSTILPEEPRWETISPDEFSFQTHSLLVRDVAYLLGFIRRNEASETSSGTMYRTALKSLTRGMSFRVQEYTEFVYAVAVHAGILAAGGRKNVYGITKRGQTWVNLSLEAQQRSLFEAWKTAVLWSESEPTMLSSGRSSRAARDRELREPILELLKECADSGMDPVSVSSLIEQASFRWWSRFEDRNAEDGLSFAARIAGSLYWLGAASVAFDSTGSASAICLTEEGRHWVRGHTAPARDAARADTFILQPNLEIYAAPGLSVPVLYRLFSIAEPSANGMLALSHDSIRQAMDHGETCESILEFLRKGSRSGIPQNVDYLVREVGGKHGQIEVGQAGLYIKVNDPAILKELQAQKGLKIGFRRLLTDNVALITGESVDSVLKTLRASGYFPRSAEQRDAHAATRSPNAARDQDDGEFTAPGYSSQNELDSRIDWELIARDDGKPYSEPLPRSEGLVREGDSYITRLVGQAIDEKRCVDIVYMPADGGSTTQRVIEPVDMNGPLVYAYCRLRQDWRNFNVRSITAARLTGERFGERD